MKNLKNNWLQAILFTALLLGVFMTVRALDNNKDKNVEKAVAPTTWHFIGTSMNKVFDKDEWQSTDPEEASCSSAARPLPCAYTVTDEDIADTGELITYLRATHQNNPSAVAPAADSRKLEE